MYVPATAVIPQVPTMDVARTATPTRRVELPVGKTARAAAGMAPLPVATGKEQLMLPYGVPGAVELTFVMIETSTVPPLPPVHAMGKSAAREIVYVLAGVGIVIVGCVGAVSAIVVAGARLPVLVKCSVSPPLNSACVVLLSGG